MPSALSNSNRCPPGSESALERTRWDTLATDLAADVCPVCAALSIRAAIGGNRCVHRCADCGAGWHYALGHVVTI